MSQWLYNDQGLLTGMSVGPLTWAVLHGRPDIALRLLQRDKKTAPADRFLPYFAAAAGNWDLVIGALPYAKAVNLADRAGVTPLMFAAHAGRTDAVRALLAAGAGVNARSAKEWPPLLETNFLAALGGHSSSRPKLVGDYTALRAAREQGHAEAVKVLSEAGGKE
jgi:ankyrin repeat protein